MQVLIGIIIVKTKNIKEVFRNLNPSLEVEVEAGGKEEKGKEAEALQKAKRIVNQGKKN